MNTIITLQNVESFSTSLSEHQLKWMFEETQKNSISKEVKAQVIPLKREAALFLLDFYRKRHNQDKGIRRESDYAKEVHTFISKKQSNETIKKWLYNLNIPLDRKVFWVNQLNVAFVMTWRMVIKFSDILFFGTDEVLWDNTMDWELSFSSGEEFCFVDNLNGHSVTKSNEAIVEPQKAKESKTFDIMFNDAVRVKDNEVISSTGKSISEKRLSNRRGMTF